MTAWRRASQHLRLLSGGEGNNSIRFNVHDIKVQIKSEARTVDCNDQRNKGVRACTCVYVRVCACMGVYVHVRVHACTCVYVRVHACLCSKHLCDVDVLVMTTMLFSAKNPQASRRYCSERKSHFLWKLDGLDETRQKDGEWERRDRFRSAGEMGQKLTFFNYFRHEYHTPVWSLPLYRFPRILLFYFYIKGSFSPKTDFATPFR